MKLRIAILTQVKAEASRAGLTGAVEAKFLHKKSTGGKKNAFVHHVRLVFPFGREGNGRKAFGSLRSNQGLVEKAGAKFVAMYFTTGTNDVVLITEAADGADAVASGMAVAASGSISRLETVRAWTPAEFKGIAEKAAKVANAYAPPGN